MYKQIDSVAMSLPLGPVLINAFLCFYEKMWLQQWPDELQPVYYRRYIDNNFVSFKCQEHLPKFQDYCLGDLRE